MTKKQHYMTREERYKLEALQEAKIPVARIAEQLGFCRQTIYNEIERGKYIHTCEWWDEERYSADKAQQVHDYNQTAKGRPLKIGSDQEYADYLERKMLGIQENGKKDRLLRLWPLPNQRDIRPLSAQQLSTVTLESGSSSISRKKTYGTRARKRRDRRKNVLRTLSGRASRTGRRSSTSVWSLGTGKWTW